jgi:CheY-like chemotaxis protein
MAQVGLLEDNPRIAKLCATMLQYAGHQVTVYAHPRDCLNALVLQLTPYDNRPFVHKQTTLSPLPVDVLILDLHLPDVDGFEVLRHLHADPAARALPLVFCTAASHAEIARALSVAPHAGFVEKPFKLQTLIAAVNSALQPGL